MDHALPDAESKAILAGALAARVTPATSTGCDGAVLGLPSSESVLGSDELRCALADDHARSHRVFAVPDSRQYVVTALRR
jgi:hypothetical protein